MNHIETGMSALGQKRTFSFSRADVRFTPESGHRLTRSRPHKLYCSILVAGLPTRNRLFNSCAKYEQSRSKGR